MQTAVYYITQLSQNSLATRSGTDMLGLISAVFIDCSLAMKLSLRIPLLATTRTYATRRAERPPPKIKDPLLSPHVTHHQITPDLTFIHRPPPTAPTPFSLTTAPSSPLLSPPSSSTAGPLPPLTKCLHNKLDAKLTEEQIEEMKRLRAADPLTYTRQRLATQFGCSPLFVPIVAPLSKTERRKALERRDHEHEANRSQWGERKEMVVAIRKKRRSLW